MYTVELTRPAERKLRALPQATQARIIPRLRALANDPRPQGCKKLAGERNLYRIRIGDHRAIYTARDAELLVLVVKVGHRREV